MASQWSLPTHAVNVISSLPNCLTSFFTTLLLSFIQILITLNSLSSAFQYWSLFRAFALVLPHVYNASHMAQSFSPPWSQLCWASLGPLNLVGWEEHRTSKEEPSLMVRI